MKALGCTRCGVLFFVGVVLYSGRFHVVVRARHDGCLNEPPEPLEVRICISCDQKNAVFVHTIKNQSRAMSIHVGLWLDQSKLSRCNTIRWRARLGLSW